MRKTSKKYYKEIDMIRAFACIAILLYHVGILKGGYLAVCTFFVLSAYLSCISAFNKERFSIVSYYKNRLLKIYLPLMIVVFTTIGIISMFPSISWLHLKPETTSILLGYNNFWQLSANLDYFAGDITSPFTHLWYIAILLQFDLLFPFIYLGLKKIGDKVDKFLPCIFTSILAIIGSIYFGKMCFTQNIMFPYYHTLTRIFSLLFGLSLGFIHSYYKSYIPKKLKKKPNDKNILYFYFLILTLLFIFVDAKSNLFAISMILTTLITCRIIDYSTIRMTRKLSTSNQIIKCIADMSYEIYLIQYPVIFLFQYISLSTYLKIPIIIITVLTLSYLLHFCLIPHHKNKKAKTIKSILCIFIGCIIIYGVYQYSIAIDHTEEMRQLENQMHQNKELMQQKQEEYAQELKKEQEVWNSALLNLKNIEEELPTMIANLSIVGIGDSVMLGAINNLYQQFPKGYFDAKVSRSVWVAKDILRDLKNKQLLGDSIIINLGTNGDCSEACKIEIMKECEGKEVFWITIINDHKIHMNDKLKEFASKYENLHIIDWYTLASNHPEYFYADGIHLTDTGRSVYTKTIYDSIYQVYLSKYQEKKQEIMNKLEEAKIKIIFYGNDILLNTFEEIQDDYKNAKFIGHTNFTYETLKEDLEKEIENQTLPESIVFAFDTQFSLSILQYQELIELCKKSKIYILSMNEQTTKDLENLQNDNLIIMPFYSKEDYLMADKIHLTEKGNQILREILKNNILMGGNK